MISNKNQTGLKFPWLQTVPISYQFLNLSLQPRSLYWVPAKITQTDITRQNHTDRCPIGASDWTPSSPSPIPAPPSVFCVSVNVPTTQPGAWVWLQDTLLSFAPNTVDSTPFNFIRYISIFPMNEILILHSKVQVWWLSCLKICQCP